MRPGDGIGRLGRVVRDVVHPRLELIGPGFLTTVRRMSALRSALPELPYDDWEDTKATLHLVTQMLGKVKLAHHPKMAHWWHMTLHVTPRGISTQTIPTRRGSFDIELVVADLSLRISTSDGVEMRFPLEGRSVSAVYENLMSALSRVGYPTKILAKPYDMPHSTLPFAEDTTHQSWDRDAIRRWWQATTFVDEVFKTFAGRSFVRTSPVHLFWHSFDYVVTRFSGRAAPGIGEGGRRSDVEAYSHEVISFGFWPGDPETRFPAFYSYTAPEPEGLADAKLEPAEAFWQPLPGSHLALLRYDDIRERDDPRTTLLAFMTSAYEAGGSRANWKQYEEQETAPFWDTLDARFPLTRDREHR